MSASVTWSGLEELKAELRALPAELASEASGIVLNSAHAAMADMHYPRRTGDLADKLKVETVSSGAFGAGARVVNTSKLAQIFESGTQVRHNALGANRGSMPPGHVFIPAVVRRRRAMYEALKAVLVQHGLQVSGDA